MPNNRGYPISVEEAARRAREGFSDFPTMSEWSGYAKPPDMSDADFENAMEGTFLKAHYDLARSTHELKRQIAALPFVSRVLLRIRVWLRGLEWPG